MVAGWSGTSSLLFQRPQPDAGAAGGRQVGPAPRGRCGHCLHRPGTVPSSLGAGHGTGAELRGRLRGRSTPQHPAGPPRLRPAGKLSRTPPPCPPLPGRAAAGWVGGRPLPLYPRPRPHHPRPHHPRRLPLAAPHLGSIAAVTAAGEVSGAAASRRGSGGRPPR